MDPIKPLWTTLNLREPDQSLQHVISPHLTNQIKNLWANKSPYILAVYENQASKSYNSCHLPNLVKLKINTKISKTFFFTLHLSKNLTISSCYLGHSFEEGKKKVNFFNTIFRAASGNKESIYEMARSFLLEDGVQKNLKMAKRWLKVSAEFYKFKKAYYYLGLLYKQSPELHHSFQNMKKCFINAANFDVVEAQYELGEFFYSKGDLSNLKKSFLWFLVAAKKNDSKSQWMLSTFYENGIGVERDLEKSYYWLIVAELNDNIEAKKQLKKVSMDNFQKTLLANAYYAVFLTLERLPNLHSEKKGMILFHAANFDHIEAEILLGQYFYEKNDSLLAKNWFAKAKEGNEIANFFYSKVDELPFSDALLSLGTQLIKGIEIPQDEKKGLYYLELAEKFYPLEVNYQLGKHYCKSIKNEDIERGVAYLKIPAKEDYRKAGNIMSLYIPD